MVLTNFECWAHGGSNEFAGSSGSNTPDLFNPTRLQSCSCNNESSVASGGPATPSHIINDSSSANVSHLSSNGYYGFVACNAVLGGNSDDVNNVHQRLAITAAAASTPANDGMEVEWQSLPFHQEPAGIDPLFHQHHNSCFDRRKRFYAENDILEMKLRNPKRFRFDNDRDFLQNNDSCVNSSYNAPNLTSMDHEDIPISLPVQNQPVSNFSNHHSSAQSQSSNNIIDPVNTFKSNSRNNRYNDISRCIASHMI